MNFINIEKIRYRIFNYTGKMRESKKTCARTINLLKVKNIKKYKKKQLIVIVLLDFFFYTRVIQTSNHNIFFLVFLLQRRNRIFARIRAKISTSSATVYRNQ